MTHASSSRRLPTAAVVPAWVVAAAVGGTVLIALGAFWLSFVALTDLARQAGIPAGQAWVWPLIVDGLIVVSTVAVVVLTPHGRRVTAYPWLLLLTGAAVSVWGNASHAVLATNAELPDSLAAVISAVPPLVLLAITHLTVELTRRTRPPTSSIPTAAASVGSSGVADPIPAHDEDGDGGDVDRQDVAWACHLDGWSNKRIARHLGVHPSTVGRWFSASNDNRRRLRAADLSVNPPAPPG